MSSFICSKETKSKITALIYAETYHPGKIRRLFWGNYSDKIKKVIEQYAEKHLNVDRVKDYNAEQVIFWILEDINAEAVGVRYKREEQPNREKPDNVLIENIYTLETYKRLCCFIYQCAEDIAERFSPIYQILEQIKNALAQRLLFNLPEFEKIDGWN